MSSHKINSILFLLFFLVHDNLQASSTNGVEQNVSIEQKLINLQDIIQRHNPADNHEYSFFMLFERKDNRVVCSPFVGKPLYDLQTGRYQGLTPHPLCVENNTQVNTMLLEICGKIGNKYREPINNFAQLVSEKGDAFINIPFPRTIHETLVFKNNIKPVQR